MDTPTDKLRALAESPHGTGIRRMLQLITGAMLSGAFLMGLVFYFLAPLQEGVPEEFPNQGEQVKDLVGKQWGQDEFMLLLSALLGLGALTFSSVIQMFQGRRNRDALAGGEGSPQVDKILNSTFTVGILTNAVREGAYLVACVFGILAETPGPFFVMAGVILLLWAFQFPTQRAFDRNLGLD